LLRQQLDWFGELALVPKGEPQINDDLLVAVAGVAIPAGWEIHTASPAPAARQAFLSKAKFASGFVIGLVLSGLGVALLGFCGLLLLLVLACLGQLRGGVPCGTSPAGVYVETFALWMLSFLLIGPVVSRLELGQWKYIGSGVIELCTLVVLVVAVAARVSFRQMCEDVGLTAGRQPFLEPTIGMGCYFMSLPILIVGVLMMLALTALRDALATPGPTDEFAIPNTPSHPIVLELASGVGWYGCSCSFGERGGADRRGDHVSRRALSAYARVVARLGSLRQRAAQRGAVELHFRGDSSSRLGGGAGVDGLGVGFVIAREWRGTVLPGMVGHGFNNAVVLLMNVVMMGD